MPLSTNVSRDTVHQLTPSEDRRRIGRYVAVGAVLIFTLLTLHHVLLQYASTIADICIPATIMACYMLWILYSVQRDRRKARLLASAVQVTEVISNQANDASDEGMTRMQQILGHDMMGMITTPRKLVAIQLTRSPQPIQIEVNNDED